MFTHEEELISLHVTCMNFTAGLFALSIQSTWLNISRKIASRSGHPGCVCVSVWGFTSIKCQHSPENLLCYPQVSFRFHISSLRLCTQSNLSLYFKSLISQLNVHVIQKCFPGTGNLAMETKTKSNSLVQKASQSIWMSCHYIDFSCSAFPLAKLLCQCNELKLGTDTTFMV